MKNIKTGILIILIMIISGCAKPDEPIGYTETVFTGGLMISEAPPQTEEAELTEDPAVQAIAYLTEEPESSAVITSAPVTDPPATEPPATTGAPPATEPDIPVVIPVKPPRSNGEKWMALTFDDGPSRHTQRILDVLEEHGARATFFVLGSNVWNHREVIKNIAAQGSEAAGHSWHHANFTALETQHIIDQIEYTDNAISHVTGLPAPKFVRPPYGAFDDAVKKAARQAGSAMILWNIDSRDWQFRNADHIYDFILDNTRDGGIILCHDIHESTAEAMERVIPALIEQGYKLVTVSELLGETIPGVVYYSEYQAVP